MSKLFKSFTAAILTLVLCFGLFSCGGDGYSATSFEKAYEEKIDQLFEQFGSGLSDHYDTDDIRVDAEIGVQVSDDLLSMLETYTSYDFGWLNDSKISVSENVKNDLASMSIAFSHDKKEVVAAELIMDIMKGDIFMSVPTLGNKFVKMAFDSYTESSSESLELIQNMADLLPDAEIFGSVVKDALSTFIGSAVQFSFAEESLRVNGIEQECVAYKVTFSQSELVAAFVNVLDMLSANENFKTLICNFATEYGKLAGDTGAENMGGILGATPEQIYEDIKYEITSLASQLKFVIASGYLGNETAVEWVSYITDADDIIGTKLDVDLDGESMSIYIASASNGNDTGFEAYLANGNEKLFEIIGETVDNGKLLSASCELKINGQSMLFIDLEDVDSKQLKDGVFVGAIYISPSKGLIDALLASSDYDFSSAGLLLSSLSVKVEVLKNNSEKIEAEISLMSGNVSYATVTLDAKFSKGKDVTLPQNAIEDIEEWANGLDIDKFIKAAEKSGLPDYIIDFLMPDADEGAIDPQ